MSRKAVQDEAAFKNSGGMSLELLLLRNRIKVVRISAIVGGAESISSAAVISCSS